MKILLVDVDSKIPNLALMKISSFHKKCNDHIDLVCLGNSGYYRKSRKEKVIHAHGYDKVYVSVVFVVNRHAFRIVGCDDVVIGGTGYDLSTVLPDEIEKCEYDYSIYPDNDNSYGFITRGCIRNCYFCFVPEKEGKISEYMNWEDIVKHDKTYFLDNNFLSYKKHKQVLKELVDNHVRFQFNQGLDIRLIDDENSALLSRSRYLGEFIFAFDDVRFENLVRIGLHTFRKHYPALWREKFFVYCHPDHSIIDVLYRVEWCRSHQVLPYLMRDVECWKSDHREFYVDLASYCNQPQFFKNRSFEKYLKDRYPYNLDRADRSFLLYKQNNP